MTLLVETDSGDDERCEEAAGHSSTCRGTGKHGCFRKRRHEHVRPFLKALHWLPVRDRIIFKITIFVFVFFFVCCCCGFVFVLFVVVVAVVLWYPATIPTIGSLCRQSFSQSPFQFRWGKKHNSFLCKMETEGLWLPVVLCSGSPCLKQPSCSHIRLCTSLSQFKTSLKPFLFTSANSELL